MNITKFLTKDNVVWTTLKCVAIGGNNDLVKVLGECGADSTAENDGRLRHLSSGSGRT